MREFADGRRAVKVSYIAQEYIAGVELFDCINEASGPFPDGVVRFFILPVLRGLQHIHGLDVTHCDLKPENILVALERLF